MRSSRFLLPFSLGAISMLGLVLAVTWSAPDTLDRLHAALGYQHPPSAAASKVPAATPPVAEPRVAIAVPPAVPAGPPPSPAEIVLPAAVPGNALELLIPVQGVLAASLVNTYDQARGQGRRHDAIDIMAPRGTPVLASSDGVVMKLFRSVRGGITLYELAPDRRTIYYYAHLDRYAPGMAEGRALRRGEVLGYVGDTGDAVPGNYHLHFEVSTTADPKKYWGGVPQNPHPLLR
ncbi:M23 family metallopeptidase [Longimicrobium sp.]|jgi:murein DD-endopeptidase MepM/ murein hydrolase activator NlpD|uniref:M23 family metallopeptidase n=1 Tax=Longimicrobium sp. TaxID=2029185 RepID=UPI002ED89A61